MSPRQPPPPPAAWKAGEVSHKQEIMKTDVNVVLFPKAFFFVHYHHRRASPLRQLCLFNHSFLPFLVFFYVFNSSLLALASGGGIQRLLPPLFSCHTSHLHRASRAFAFPHRRSGFVDWKWTGNTKHTTQHAVRSPRRSPPSHGHWAGPRPQLTLTFISEFPALSFKILELDKKSLVGKEKWNNQVCVCDFRLLCWLWFIKQEMKSVK